MSGRAMSGSAVATKKTVKIPSGLVAILIIVACASFWLSDYWRVFLLVGILFTITSFFPSKKPHAVAGQKVVSKEPEGVAMATNQFLIPQTWDPTEIGIQVRKLKSDAGLVRVFVDSVVQRFVIGQDNYTARVRIEFLKSKLEELTLSKELQASLDELQFRKLNLEIQQLELEKKKSNLQLETKRYQEISDLERRRDTLKLKLEIEGLMKQMDAMRNPSKPEPRRSPEESKQENRERVERGIREVKQKLKLVHEDPELDDDAKRRMENIFSKKLDELYEELEQYI